MNYQPQNNAPTFESVWASIQESNRYLTEKQAETDRQMKETDRQMKETDKKLDRLEKMIGGISRSNGEFCEEYFVNAFKANPTFLGEKYDRVIDDLRPEPVVVNDQYDLVLRNGKTVVLIEMKYKANIEDVGKMFSKLHSYRANYPMFKEYKTYLCLASFRFPAKVRERAAQEGIVLIEQRGEKIEVISENFKTW